MRRNTAGFLRSFSIMFLLKYYKYYKLFGEIVPSISLYVWDVIPQSVTAKTVRQFILLRIPMQVDSRERNLTQKSYLCTYILQQIQSVLF